jgi:integrase
LPKVATAPTMTAVLTDAETRAHGGDAIALRDAALVELLYASALRVSELCGTDVDDIDRERRTVRVVGKGSKERVVPYGAPAAHALDAYLARGRSVLVGRGSGTAALFVGARGARLGARSAYDVVSRVVSSGGRAERRSSHAAPLRSHSSARRRRRPAHGAGDARSCQSRNDPDLHTCLGGATGGRVPAGASSRVSASRACSREDLRALRRCRRHRGVCAPGCADEAARVAGRTYPGC